MRVPVLFGRQAGVLAAAHLDDVLHVQSVSTLFTIVGHM